MKDKKTLFNILFLVLCIGLTIYFVFRGQDLETILDLINKAHWGYWMIGVFFVIAFILSESFIIWYMMRALKQKAQLTHCFLYSFIGFFFSLITPSASGGQPMQILFMKKDKLPIHISTLVLLMVTITYKLVLVLIGIVVLVVCPAEIMDYLEPVMGWMYLGIALNIVCVGGMLLLVFWPELTKRLVMACFRFVKRLFKSPKIDRLEKKIEKGMDGYSDAARFFVDHKGVIVNVLLITFAQRCFLFLITYLVLLSFDITSASLITAVVLQAMISMAVDMLPLPGGLGISEHLYSIMFLPICGSLLTTPTMIVSRGIAYYTQLLISALFTLVAYFTIFKRRNEE